MILRNGVIRTMDPQLPRSSALSIAGELVAGAVGTHESALPTPDVVDLGGRCVLPGFTDSHTHFLTWSLAQREVRLEGATSLAEAVERVRAAADALPAGAWLIGTGWRSEDWPEGDEPTREALDGAVGERPVSLMNKDEHSLWLSTAALARADVDDLAVPGGVVELDARGEPTGILRERSAWLFRDRHVVVSDDEVFEAMRLGMRLANSRGVVAVHDKDGWKGILPHWQRLAARAGLSLRVWQSVPAAQLDALVELGARSRLGDDYLRLGYLKTFMDGTLGSRTALMLDGSGVRITGREELEELIVRAAAAGWPLSVHAIGDRANRDALDAFEATAEVWQPLGLRQRIEHAQCVDPVDLPRFAELGVACSVQFAHAPSDRDMAERYWGDRLEGAYAFRSLLDSGAVVANGSDAPVEELDPLAGIRAAVRRTIDGRPAWRAEEALTIEQALHASTVAPAWLAGDDRRRGRLVPNFLADLVVLSHDPFELAPDELDSLEVVATMVGGRWVHNPPPWD